jgi:hypothetical protein
MLMGIVTGLMTAETDQPSPSDPLEAAARLDVFNVECQIYGRLVLYSFPKWWLCAQIYLS